MEKGTSRLTAKALSYAPFSNRLHYPSCYGYFVYYMTHDAFGQYVRERREELRKGDRHYSLRQVAGRVGIEPAYLSKVERGEVAPPGEATTVRLAEELGEDTDVMLALAGRCQGTAGDHPQAAEALHGCCGS